MSEQEPVQPVADSKPRLREVWQLPALVLGVALLAGGVVVGVLSKPKPEVGPELDRAAAVLEAHKYQEALDILNRKVRPHVGTSALSEEQAGRFHLLVARTVYYGQRSAGASRTENYATVAEHYHLAGENVLEPADRANLAESLTAMGRLDEALALTNGLPAESRRRGIELYRSMIESVLAGAKPNHERALDLLSRLTADPELPVDDRAWAVARQTDILLSRGFGQEAIAKLSRAMPRVQTAGPAALGELYLLLGQAYNDTGQPGEAETQFDRAARMLPEHSDLSWRVKLLQAMVRVGRGDEDSQGEARDLFRDVMQHAIAPGERLAACLGLGEVEARLGGIEPSVEAYQKVVDGLGGQERVGSVTPAVVSTSLMLRFNERMTAGDRDNALRYANLAQAMHEPDTTPAEVLDGLARVHRALADDLLGLDEDSSGRIIDLALVDPATRRQAREHYASAGAAAKLHAARIGASNAEAFVESMWLAADSYDRAGDQQAAVALFQDYVSSFPSDQRHTEAKFRLAQAYQSRGDYELAATLYRELLDGGDAARAGPWADRSLVPLAQSYLLDTVADNDAEAQRLLLNAVSGSHGGPQSGDFREALHILGRHYYQSGQHERAIERLEETLARYPEDARVDSTRFQLGDCNRLSAGAITSKLAAEALPSDERAEMENLRISRLSAALGLYQQAKRGLEAIDPRRRTQVENLYLRNSYFYIGDCAFDLGDYESAIRHYDASRERYPQDPASLVAMVQIVSAHLKQGDTKRAATANNRALKFFQTIPDTVWDDPRLDLPMSKSAWKNWLESMAELSSVDGAGSASAESATPSP